MKIKVFDYSKMNTDGLSDYSKEFWKALDKSIAYKTKDNVYFILLSSKDSRYTMYDDSQISEVDKSEVCNLIDSRVYSFDGDYSEKTGNFVINVVTDNNEPDINIFMRSSEASSRSIIGAIKAIDRISEELKNMLSSKDILDSKIKEINNKLNEED